MPPLDAISLTRLPLDIAAATAQVCAPEAGGIALFLGTTRAESRSADEPQSPHDPSGALVALDYHAYDEMALAQMRRLAQEAQRRWPVRRLVLWHRLGLVNVGEASVLVAVACPHRGEAFAACQFVIDELKKSVPIWKKEIYRGHQRWQET